MENLTITFIIHITLTFHTNISSSTINHLYNKLYILRFIYNTVGDRIFDLNRNHADTISVFQGFFIVLPHILLSYSPLSSNVNNAHQTLYLINNSLLIQIRRFSWTKYGIVLDDVLTLFTPLPVRDSIFIRLTLI